jgi:signal transduction histidine kinase/DNA-binding NarL/FixJ family response regulator
MSASDARAAVRAGATAASPYDTGSPPMPARHARLRACTILLVDDEEANLDLLEALLDGAGYGHLVRTADARDVMPLVERHAPDLVLLDLHMPHRHGLQVLADLRAATPEDEYRPVLVLTADITTEAREYALSLGARDFVTKPFDTSEVLLRVENLLDARALHAGERRARERAEAAEARSALLAEWSRLLAASLDPAAAAAHLQALMVPRWAATCDVVLGATAASDAAASGSPASDVASAPTLADAPVATPRLTAPVATGEGVVGRIVLAGRGTGPDALAADQALVDELAARLGLAAEHARLLAAAELATRERERLLAVVAHDLRNPLGAIAMYAEVLASLQPDAAEGVGRGDAYARAALATIHTTAAGMQRIVEDLLDATSLHGGAIRVHRAPRRVGEPFEQAERMLRPMADAAGLAFAVIPEGDAADHVGALDAGRLVQLLSNLVGNAVKFTSSGGAVTVRYAADTDGLRTSVTDTGPGIAADDLPHLFTAFWRGDARDERARDARRGVGLGLWIAQAIVEAHGGTLRVESRPAPAPAPGTTFHFTIPFADAARRWED